MPTISTDIHRISQQVRLAVQLFFAKKGAPGYACQPTETPPIFALAL